MQSKQIVIATAFVTAAGAAGAADFTISTPAATLPAGDGSGLTARFYSFDARPDNLAKASALVAGASAPTATFTALTVCFPSCGNTANDDSTSLANYVGSNGANLVGAAAGLRNSVTLFDGYIAVRDVSAAYTFSLGSDDGSQLVIAGIQVINNDGDHGFTTYSRSVQFSSVGLYSFYVQQFEDQGVTGVSVWQNGNALATRDLYDSVTSVPEPASFVMLGAGAAALALFRRRQRI